MKFLRLIKQRSRRKVHQMKWIKNKKNIKLLFIITITLWYG
jgi:hypothetical protein